MVVAKPDLVMSIGSRHIDDSVGLSGKHVDAFEESVARWSEGWVRSSGGRAPAFLEPAKSATAIRVVLYRLIAADVAFLDRLQLEAIAAHEATAQGAMWQAALAGRALPALRKAGIPATLRTIELAPPGAEPAVEPGHVRLPLSWLTNVWGRRVGAVGGHFVTGVTAVHDDGRKLDVRIHGIGKATAVRGVGTREDDWRLLGA